MRGSRVEVEVVRSCRGLQRGWRHGWQGSVLHQTMWARQYSQMHLLLPLLVVVVGSRGGR